MTSSLHKLLAEGVIRYSQVWEDHALVESGLDVGPSDDVLSIASAGCNVFSLLLREPRSVLAIDVNPAQIALVALKARAIEALEHDELLRFLGITPGDDRVTLYDRVRPRLDDDTRTFWDTREDALARGVHWSGRLETFFRGFHVEVLPTVHAPETTARLLAMDDVAEQARFFESTYATEAMKRAFTGYFTRERLASEGRDPRQMRYVAAMDVAGFFWDRFRWVLTSLPARDNFYVQSFLSGRYIDSQIVPPYLRRESYARLRGLLPRLQLEVTDVDGALRARPDGAFSKANLSDLFEYLADEIAEALFASLGARLRPGGRACYWNLLVPRAASNEAREAREADAAGAAARPIKLRPLRELSRALHARDRSWFYRAFHVDEVASE